MSGSPSARDRRLLFLAATSKDAATMQAMLAPLAIQVEPCRSFETLLHEIGAGVGALLLPEEAALPAHHVALRGFLAAQPPWSDLPILILTRPGLESAATEEAGRVLGNVTLIERPVRVATLVSAVRTAIRARERQYQIREHLEERIRSEAALRLADQRKDEFLATLGHELRNPLAPLLTAHHLLKTASLRDPVAVRVSGVMERQLTHLVRLVDDLLEVSRITRGLIEMHRETLDLAAIVNAAIDTSRPVIEAAGHELVVDAPARPIAVAGDAVRLTQVFANLLTNAAKYTNGGGRIAVAIRQEGEVATVSVSDNGIGIAGDQLASVFDMFTQLDRSNRRAQGGLGIGLTLVRSLVEMHGGRAEARSGGLGHGSEFVVELPAVDASGLQPAVVTAPQPFPARRVLIVDDNRDAAETLGALLFALGTAVEVVHSGQAALDALDRFEPDCVVLDIGMPGMDGYETARRIRASAFSGVLLVALTGWGQEHDQRRAEAAGFDHHIVKPPDLDRLRDLLTRGRLEPSVRPAGR